MKIKNCKICANCVLRNRWEQLYYKTYLKTERANKEFIKRERVVDKKSLPCQEQLFRESEMLYSNHIED